MVKLGTFNLIGKYKQYWRLPNDNYMPAEMNTLIPLSSGFLFVGNRPNTSGQGEDIRIIRTDDSFHALDSMTLLHGGHGSGIGCHEVNGKIELYAMVAPFKEKNIYDMLIRFNYQPNTILNSFGKDVQVLKYFNSGQWAFNGEAMLSHDGNKIITVEHGNDINQMGLNIWGINDTGLTQEPLHSIKFNDIHQGLYKDGKNLNIYQGIGWGLNDDTIWMAWGWKGHQPNDIKYDPTNIINLDYKTGTVLYSKNVDVQDASYQIDSRSTIEIESLCATPDGSGLYVLIIAEGEYYNDLTSETSRGYIYYVPLEEVD